MNDMPDTGVAATTLVPAVKAVLLSPARPLGNRPLLVVGASLGTSSVLWKEVGGLLGAGADLDGAAVDATGMKVTGIDVVAWDLPGHGTSPASQAPFTVAELAEAVVGLVDSMAPGARFHYAGVSLGGAVGLKLGITHADRILSLSIQCSGPKLGTPEAWEDRAETVRTLGTDVMIEGSAQRWFGAGFLDREPILASELLNGLRDADQFSYAHCCQALAGFDARNELGRIRVPLLAVAGAEDQVATPDMMQDMVAAVNAGATQSASESKTPADSVATLATLPHVGHLAPAEAPTEVARLLSGLIEGVRP